MLSDSITLSDGTNNHTYVLVSQAGMESLRRESGVVSRAGSTLKISNTIDLNNASAKNRHLIQMFWKDDDADGVASYEGSVHVVIARDKNVTDAKLKEKLYQLGVFIQNAANIDAILIGGN